ncbi:MAG: DUF4331 family protein [Gemmatimonadaceae bacterium]
MLRKSWMVVASLGTILMAGACDDNDNEGATGPVGSRTFDQIERLGNPLVSEVTFMKRDHGLHNTANPHEDVGLGFKTKVETFVTTVAGRSSATAQAIANVLIPDMLIVETSKAGNTAGWLSWALANAYGGRTLTDDVVDAGLMAIFGPLLDPNNVTPGLTTDNVPANNKAFLATFPYLATPN